MKLLAKRPGKKISFLNFQNILFILKKELNYYLRKRNNIMSSCLTRSLLARLIFDLINVKNELWVGILKNGNKKILHAWLYDPMLNVDITPSFSHIKNASAFKIDDFSF